MTPYATVYNKQYVATSLGIIVIPYYGARQKYTIVVLVLCGHLS